MQNSPKQKYLCFNYQPVARKRKTGHQIRTWTFSCEVSCLFWIEWKETWHYSIISTIFIKGTTLKADFTLILHLELPKNNNINHKHSDRYSQNKHFLFPIFIYLVSERIGFLLPPAWSNTLFTLGGRLPIKPRLKQIDPINVTQINANNNSN